MTRQYSASCQVGCAFGRFGPGPSTNVLDCAGGMSRVSTTFSWYPSTKHEPNVAVLDANAVQSWNVVDFFQILAVSKFLGH